jgi:magnesium chelatase family protein
LGEFLGVTQKEEHIMLSKTFSVAINGIDAHSIEIEVNATQQGEKSIVSIVGLPDTAVKESKDRVRSALRSCGFQHPRGATVINLAPADIKKEGAGFDLPIAVGLIASTGDIDREKLAKTILVGELALDGSVRPVKGMIPAGLRAKEDPAIEALLVPAANVEEAAIAADGLPVYPVQTLADAVQYFKDDYTVIPLI